MISEPFRQLKRENIKLFLSLTRRNFKAAFSHVKEANESSIIKFMDHALKGMFISLLMLFSIYANSLKMVWTEYVSEKSFDVSKENYVKSFTQSAINVINSCMNLGLNALLESVTEALKLFTLGTVHKVNQGLESESSSSIWKSKSSQKLWFPKHFRIRFLSLLLARNALGYFQFNSKSRLLF